MTKQEASERCGIPVNILDEYESWGLCPAVKKVMGAWQYDESDIQRLNLILTLHDIGFEPAEVENYMRLVLEGGSTIAQRMLVLGEKRRRMLDEASSKEIVKRGLELGVNFYDTAIGYQGGTGEEYLGRILREEEREMAKLCAEDNIAMTPYSALADGRLSKRPGETSKRLEEDSYAKGKYDVMAEQDGQIITRVAELADKHGVGVMAQNTPAAAQKQV